jgi:predicted Zn-dependent protease
MQRQIAWARGKEFLEGAMLASEAEVQAYRGCIAKARQLALQAAASSLRDGDADSAALSKGLLAFIEVESGNVAGAHKAANAVVALTRNKPMTTKTRQALAWAIYSDPDHSMVGEIAKEAPLDTLVQHYWLPILRGQVELQNGHADRAIEILQEATPYELHFPGAMLAVYIRGKAYLKLGNGPAAIAEFQNIIQHSGLIGFEPTGALARLELARAWVLQAQSSSAQTAATEKSRALAAYQDFLNLWKDADPDLPILRQAKAECTRLQ